MTPTKRIVFFLSDSTGITVDKLGHSLLSQFGELQFHSISLRYIDSAEKAQQAYQQISEAADNSTAPPLVFSTLADASLRAIIRRAPAVFFDMFEMFVPLLEQSLQQAASLSTGRTHGVVDVEDYSSRIDAVNYALNNDDGINTRRYNQAEIILVGVSRSGKTPTCLYLALQFGVYAANYPLTEEHGLDTVLPEVLRPYRSKLFGLTIQPHRLQQIRAQRRPQSRYASMEYCRREIALAEELFITSGIPFVDTTSMSVEEIATHLLSRLGREI